MVLETVGIAAMVVVIVGSGIGSLPWTDRELRSSFRAFGVVAALLRIPALPRRSVRAALEVPR